MKKSLIIGILSIMLSSSGACAMVEYSAVEQGSSELSFSGYKTGDFVKVTGKFVDVKYKFGKGGSTVSLLTGATATIKASSVLMPIDLTTKNIRDSFFGSFKDKSDISVMFKKVVAKDHEDSGWISAKIKMNGITTTIPLEYKVEDGTLTIWGNLELTQFDIDKSFKELARVAPGHKGLTWPVIDLVFTAKLK